MGDDYTSAPRGIEHFNPQPGDVFSPVWVNECAWWWAVGREYTWRSAADGPFLGATAVWTLVRRAAPVAPAPDLRDVVRELVDALQWALCQQLGDDGFDTWASDARIAIAKAEGVL